MPKLDEANRNKMLMLSMSIAVLSEYQYFEYINIANRRIVTNGIHKSLIIFSLQSFSLRLNLV